MKILIFGASGLIGRGLLRECLLDDAVKEVRVVGRTMLPNEMHLPTTKLSKVIAPNFFDLSALTRELAGFDACFICLGVDVKTLMNPSEYERSTYAMTLAIASFVTQLNQQIVLTYVSGAGSESTHKNTPYVLKVKAKTEQALLALPNTCVLLFRPYIVKAVNGEIARNHLYRTAFFLASPFLWIFQKLMPHYIVTTEQMGRAMLFFAKSKTNGSVFTSRKISEF